MAVSDKKKSLMQFVPNAARNVKFHSSRVETDQFIARNAIEKRKGSKEFYFLDIGI